MGSTFTTYTALLKERYGDPSIVEELTYPENCLLTMLDKKGDTGMVGADLKVPIVAANPQGTGITFSTAQTNATNIVASAFAIVAGDYYGVVQIGDKVFMASRTNNGAYLENKRVEIDGLYEQAGENLSIYLWGNGGQSIGQVASISTNDVFLADPSQSANFEPGMLLVASANDGSDAAHTLRAGSATLTSINRATGDALLNTVGGITGLAVGDSLFRQSDFFGNTGNVALKGVQSFIPATDAAVNTTLWGVTGATRITDVQRYGGCRVDPNALLGKTYEERIKILLAQMTGRFKAKAATAGFMHPEEFQVLETLMSARGIRPLDEDNAKFGFQKIEIATAAGRIPIYTDRHCPKGHFFAFRMDNLAIHSMGELLHPQTGDGLEMLRRATSTDYEFRLLSYPLLACNAPKNLGRCALT